MKRDKSPFFSIWDIFLIIFNLIFTVAVALAVDKR